MSQKIGIVTECVCDLPDEVLKAYDIQMIHFQIKTDRGSFQDTVEISTQNVFEYILEQGNIPISEVPGPEGYAELYRRMLERYDEVIHVAISGKVSRSCAAAAEAIRAMGEAGARIHVFDSGHLSTGQGFLIVKAAEMAQAGASVPEILDSLVLMRGKVSTSFMVENVDFLFFNGRLSDRVRTLCGRWGLHPVLAMKNGELVLDTVFWGGYDKAIKKYVKRQLKRPNEIIPDRVFVTHAGCSRQTIDEIKREIDRYCAPKELIVTEASATISSNCGPNAFGVLFCRR